MLRRFQITILAIILVFLFITSQYMAWQEQSFDYVYNYMFEFSTPKLRSIMASGHDALMADMTLIRGIQFYGMNYPLFDRHPLKYDQFKDLSDSMIQLDKRHHEGMDFWGFAMTSAERGKADSYRLLYNGAQTLAATDEYFHEPLPPLWKLAKNAGFVATYELEEETPEWACDAYRLAQISPECPEFIHRLEYYACKAIEPDPLPHLEELAGFAARTDNEALRELNLSHIRRIVASEHKRFWDGALEAYEELRGRKPERLKDLYSVEVMQTAFDKYREISQQWFEEEGKSSLYPNLLNPAPAPGEVPEVVRAGERQMPIDPFAGEYMIIQVKGQGPTLISSGEVMAERGIQLGQIEMMLTAYKDTHDGNCPFSIEDLENEMNTELQRADRLGYPLTYDPGQCKFYYPPIAEDSPPPLYPYDDLPFITDVGEEDVGTEQPEGGMLQPMKSPSVPAGAVQPATTEADLVAPATP